MTATSLREQTMEAEHITINNTNVAHIISRLYDFMIPAGDKRRGCGG
jgi:hypothetical protein